MKEQEAQKQGQTDQIGSRTLPLSVVFDSLQEGGESRGHAFVRRVCDWLHARSDVLELDVVEALGLEDVVVTFKMKDKVSLIITGYPADGLPGAVTLSIGEEEFPQVAVRVCALPRPAKYEICTMDYSLGGSRVTVVQGDGPAVKGAILVASTIGSAQNCRIRLDSGETITAVPDDVAFDEGL